MNIRSTATKFAVAGLAGALMLAVATPSDARSGRTAAAAAGGFVAGAVVGSAIANSQRPYYGHGYARGPYYAPGPYAYDPGPYYAPGTSAYAYQPAPGRGGDYEITYDKAGNPIKASDLGPGCTLGMKYEEKC